MKNNFVRALALALCLTVPISPVAAQTATAAAATASAAPGVRLAAPQLVSFRQAAGSLVGSNFSEGFSAAAALQNLALSQHQGERVAMPLAEQAATQLLIEALSSPARAQDLLSRVDLPKETREKLSAAALRVEAESKTDPAVASALAALREQALPASRFELPARRAQNRVLAFLKKTWSFSSAPAPEDQDGFSSDSRQEGPRELPPTYDQDITPSSKKIAQLLLLSEKDPAAGRVAAMAMLRDKSERRVEVRISALRLIEAMPAKELVPFLLNIVENDFSWYIRRESARVVGTRAAELGDSKSRAEDVMRKLYKSQLAPLRLMAAEVLVKMGVDPGPEPFMSQVKTEDTVPAPSSLRKGGDASRGPQKPGWFRRLLPLILIVSTLWMGYGLMNHSADPSPAPQNQIVLVEGAPQAAPAAAIAEQPAAPAPTLQSDRESLQQIAENTRKAAEAAERSALANEKAAAAMEKMGQPQSGGGIGSMVLSALIFIGVLMGVTWLIGKFKGKGGGVGASGAPGLTGGMKKNAKDERPSEQFSDVAGIDDAMVSVQELADFLRDPAKYQRMGAQIPKGVLLEGPPGTGKTLLAKALAGSTNAAFLPMSGSNFIELYVGVGASRVRELFAEARRQAPAIIFIDEIDAVGKARGGKGPMSGANSEADQTINQILAEMDGFDGASGVIVVAATNRADVLDEALLRPGRFDRKIYVGQPDVLGREAILQIHAAKRRLAPEVDLRFIAQRTAGLSGAYLKGIINEAALLAVRKRADAIGMAHFNEAIDNQMIGQQRNLFIPQDLKKRVAEHEVGHVVAMRFTKTGTIPNKVTIIPTGSGALGWAEPGGQEDQFLSTQPELEDRLVGYAGGMVAEEDVYGNISTGPGSDLAAATRIARAMVEKLAMSKVVGPIVIGDPGFGGRNISEELAQKIDREVVAIISRAKLEAQQILAAHKATRNAIVKALMDKETLSRDEIEDIIRKTETPAAPPAK